LSWVPASLPPEPVVHHHMRRQPWWRFRGEFVPGVSLPVRLKQEHPRQLLHCRFWVPAGRPPPVR